MSLRAGDTVFLQQENFHSFTPPYEILLLEERKSKACGQFFLCSLHYLDWSSEIDTTIYWDVKLNKSCAVPCPPRIYSSTKSDALTLLYFYPDSGKITILGGKNSMKGHDFSGLSVWEKPSYFKEKSEKVEVVEVMKKE